MTEDDLQALENESDFMLSRIKDLEGWPVANLRLLANRKKIDLTGVCQASLARRIAETEAERIGLMPPGQPLADEPGPSFELQEDADGAPYPGPSFELQEDADGAPYPGRDLPQEIMNGWIGAVGGMDWYNGPTKGAKRARKHGAALAATLDAVWEDLPLAMRETPYDIRTSSGWFIYESILPELLAHFFAKNADYGDQHRDGLGPAAEYVGLHRKLHKLKSSLWEGQRMNGEDTKEMLFDLVGQILIILDLIAAEKS